MALPPAPNPPAAKPAAKVPPGAAATVKPDGKDRDADLLRSFADRETIFKEGDRGVEMFIIERGQVEILRVTPRREKRLAVLRPGEFFGEMSVLEEAPRTAAARAIGETRLLPIDGPTFDRIVHEHPEIAVRVMRRLCRRLREDARRLRELSAERSAIIPPAGAASAAASIAAPSVAAPSAAAPSAAAPSAAVAVEARTADPDPAAAAAAAIPAAAPAAARPRLAHSGSGREFPLAPRGETSVGRYDATTGRAPDIDLGPLDGGRSLSRRHVLIVERDGRYFVREERVTSNGTWVAGERLRAGDERELHDGEALRVGVIETVFRLGG